MAVRLENGNTVCVLKNGVFQLVGSKWVEPISGFSVQDYTEGRHITREELEEWGAFPLPDGTTAEEYK